MILGDRDRDTICAVSSPPGYGGISVIRISGSVALSLCRKICSFIPATAHSHHAYFGTLKDKLTDEDIDEVIATVFHHNKSFTGEETVEISCHGSPVICQRILQNLVDVGARMADPGEFTYRAFMGGRIDLIQAESVLSMVSAKSQQGAKQALRQLKGALSEELELLESDVTWCLAHLEAGIDFSENGLDLKDGQILTDRLATVKKRLITFIESYRFGRNVRDGFRVVIAGAPNVGKSSLFNALIGEDRAIVTNIAGTTRDLIETSFNYMGYQFVLTDTAGLHESSDFIERKGMEKSTGAMADTDVVLVVFDLSKGPDVAALEKIDFLNSGRAIFVGNKVDLVEDPELELLSAQRLLQEFGICIDSKDQYVILSALTKKNVDSLKSALLRLVNEEKFRDQSSISQARHFENLFKAEASIQLAINSLASRLSSEFIALDLKEALIKIQETLGKRFDDQVMDRVFKEFCIGK